MKIKLSALMFIAFIACKKETAKPAEAATGTVPVVNEFYYRIVKQDRGAIYKNNTLITDTNYFGGHRIISLNKGDSLTFVYASTVDSAGGFNFAIWNAENTLPTETIKYYYPKRDTINGGYFIKGNFYY